jgi:hypothetical protein
LVLWYTGAVDFALWWATNREAPRVTLTGPTEVIRGPATVSVRLPPRARLVGGEFAGKPVETAESMTVETSGLPDGDHRLVVIAEDSSWHRNRGRAELVLRTDNTPPKVRIESEPTELAAGHPAIVRVSSDEPATVDVRLGDHKLELQPGDGYGWLVVGFGPASGGASVALTVDATDQIGNRASQRVDLMIKPTEFPREQLQVPASLVPLLAPERREAEDKRLAVYYESVTQPKLWQGRFVVPVQGQIVTPFGEVRSYNGAPPSGNHGGIDISAPMGRPVGAANRGKVVAVETVDLRGLVVILDHGLGVFTTYAHLASADVKVGQTVDRGQTIGKVGSTGLSTGPHLHWELWVGGVNVDPTNWTKNDLP